MTNNTRIIIAEPQSCATEEGDADDAAITSDGAWPPSVPSERTEASSYDDAWQWITRNSTSGDAVRLARLLLYLSQTERWGYSAVCDCTAEMDERSLKVALPVFRYYLSVGPNAELRSIAREALSMFPTLSETSALTRVVLH